MDKSKIYIDLSKCTEEERKSLPQILEKAGQEVYFLTKHTLLSGKLDMYYPYLVFSRPSSNVWVFSHNKPDITELTYPEFIKLFEGGDEKSVEELLSDIDYWATKYEFTFQFWGDANNNLFIRKGGVSMYDNGGLETPKEAILDALKYINKINRTKF